MRIVRHNLRVFLILAVCWLAAGPDARGQVPPDAKDRYLEILRARGDGAYAKALEEATQLAAEHPELEAVHRTIVDLYLLLDRTDAGRLHFQQQIERDPQSPYAYYALGRLDLHDGDLDGAIEWYQRAISREPELAEAFGLHHGLPRVYEAKRDFDSAIDYFEELTASSPETAGPWSGLGWSYARSFDYSQSLPAFERALEINPEHVQTHHGLVQSLSRMGQFQKALESCDALTRAATRNGDFEMLVYASMMRGTITYRRGDYRNALLHLREAQTLSKEIGDRARQGTIVNNTAVIYATAGDYERALSYFELSLELAGQSGLEGPTAIALGNIGNVHKRAGRYEESIEHYREAADIARDAGSWRQLASSLANMAESYHLRGDLDTASGYYDEALEMAERTHNTMIEGFVAGLLGGLNRDRGRYLEALDYFERQLAIGERTGEVQAIWEAQAGLGSTYEIQGKADEAITHYAKAIAHYDTVRESLAIESSGSAFLENKYEAYPSIIALLADEGSFGEAFAYAEKYKAKGFLDILARGHTLFESQVPETLRLELDAIRDELQEAHAELARSDGSDVALEERITALELRRVAIVDRVREEHGDYYQLALSEPLDVSTIQSDVLEPGQYLLEYVIGDDKLSIFVVSRDERHYREVPVGRDELRQRLSELSPMFDADAARSNLLNPELADFSIPPARALYQVLLEPVAEWLPEGAELDTELIIVPDDFLFYLPFELLVAESDGAEHRYDFSAATFVVERYAVSYSPSASLLDPALRRTREYAKGVLAFGNPTFSSDEQPPLPNSEVEVEAVGDAFVGYDNGVFTGEEATKAVFDGEAADYGVLHFATHFLSDDTQPLYSRIALAGDDVLQTYEIFDARLNAELAVLSACNTGLGKLEKGEGLIGISRAFLYAGVPSLVVSLWSVDDAATARIMELFYEQLRAGASKKQALRQAKLDYLNEASGEGKDPFYWAPFILSGDWRPLALPAPAPRSNLLPVTVVFVIALGALFVWKRRRSAA